VIEPGDYCAIVSIEFTMVQGVQSKGYRMFTFTQNTAQSRSEISDWVINETVRMIREDAIEDGVSHLPGENFIPLFVSIEPD
jgi:hypothetical protein